MISVIVPTAHRPQLLMRALKSVLTQSMSDLEVIVVVDGPNPETTKLLSDIADDHCVSFRTRDHWASREHVMSG